MEETLKFRIRIVNNEGIIELDEVRELKIHFNEGNELIELDEPILCRGGETLSITPIEENS